MESMWHKAKAQLQKKLTPNNFAIWIAPIEYIDFDADHLDLKTPDQHFSNHLKDHFLNEIQEAVDQSFGNEIKIEFSSRSKPQTSTKLKEKTSRKDCKEWIFPRCWGSDGD